MNRKIVMEIIHSLLVIATIGLAFPVQPAKAAQEPQLLLETDKDVYVLGENVTITITNISNEAVEIGGWPAWTIFTHPEEEPVYPKIFATLLWWLEPEESDTIVWNQYNAYTETFVEPRMYVVKDNQGWGLSAYFEIIAAAVGGEIILIKMNKPPPALTYMYIWTGLASVVIPTVIALISYIKHRRKQET